MSPTPKPRGSMLDILSPGKVKHERVPGALRRSGVAGLPGFQRFRQPGAEASGKSPSRPGSPAHITVISPAGRSCASQDARCLSDQHRFAGPNCGHAYITLIRFGPSSRRWTGPEPGLNSTSWVRPVHADEIICPAMKSCGKIVKYQFQIWTEARRCRAVGRGTTVGDDRRHAMAAVPPRRASGPT